MASYAPETICSPTKPSGIGNADTFSANEYIKSSAGICYGYQKDKVLDATKIMLSSTNHLDTLYNLLTYVQLRLRDQPVINQFLYDQYSASEGAEEMTKLLLQRVERLHDELQGLQDDINQDFIPSSIPSTITPVIIPMERSVNMGAALSTSTLVLDKLSSRLIMDAMSRAEYAARSTMPTPNVIRNPTRTDHVRGEM
ncbi:unnamed protein product [Timema podura]|uniref:Uncharacterized protein n=1 Tax=Timema podura TaxID=61482 RepID=A0ABN7NCP7_TIMPD|nr:unnamed protein product [Timema podura]